MARILNLSAEPPSRRIRRLERRFAYDVSRLVARFGGRAHLDELARQFGVPTAALQADFFNQERRLCTYMPTLLELAERMHEPLDLYQYVVERR